MRQNGISAGIDHPGQFDRVWYAYLHLWSLQSLGTRVFQRWWDFNDFKTVAASTADSDYSDS